MILYTGSQIETEWDLNCLFVYAEKNADSNWVFPKSRQLKRPKSKCHLIFFEITRTFSTSFSGTVSSFHQLWICHRDAEAATTSLNLTLNILDKTLVLLIL